MIVPTTSGTLVFDGRTGQEIADLSPNLGLQNAPLVTEDPNGTIGITLAGYIADGASPNGVGEIDHYEIAGSNGAEAVGGAAWPMFHHDPQLTGDAGGTTPIGSLSPCSVPAAAYSGYILAASDGGIFTFGAEAVLRLDRRAASSTRPSWAWPWPRRSAGTGRWRPTAGSSPSAGPGSTAPKVENR